MSQFTDLMQAGAVFSQENFGEDSQCQGQFLIVSGKKLPIIQNSIPIDADSITGGFVVGGEGQIAVAKYSLDNGHTPGLYDLIGGNPKPETLVKIQVADNDPDTLKIKEVTTNHTSPWVLLTLAFNS